MTDYTDNEIRSENPTSTEQAVHEAARMTVDGIAAEVKAEQNAAAAEVEPAKAQTEHSAEPSAEEQPQPEEAQEAPSQATFGSGEWQRVEPEEPKTPKKKRKIGKVLLGIVAVLLAAGICFGAGYAGVTVANNTKNKVVLQQIVSPTAESGENSRLPASAEGALTSVQVADKVRDSVVAITTEQMTTGNYWYGSYVISGAGSGIIISEDGYILTCAHVINDATKITVELSDGSTYDAQLVGSYVNGDIAVVKIDATGLTPSEIADSDAILQGAVCYAVGNPQGRFSGSISDGIVSALNRTITVEVESSNGSRGNSLYDMFYGNVTSRSTITLNVIQMTAAVSPGNSGGALYNDLGQLIGVVSAKSSDSDSEGLGFAIPSNTAMEIATQLIANGYYEAPDEGQNGETGGVTPTTNKAILGVLVQTITDEDAARYNLRAGIYISEITEESTRQAGLQVGDRIISVDDVLVNAATDVTGYLAEKNPGDVVTLNVERNGRMATVQVTLVANPNA